MSTWPIRADGSAAFNDAVAVGASGISAASTSMSYATMIANIAPSAKLIRLEINDSYGAKTMAP